jgi:hypothetical protein
LIGWFVAIQPENNSKVFGPTYHKAACKILPQNHKVLLYLREYITAMDAIFGLIVKLSLLNEQNWHNNQHQIRAAGLLLV